MENNIIRKSVFLCTHNAVRSQMVEAFLNHLCGDRYSAFSAGSDPFRFQGPPDDLAKECGKTRDEIKVRVEKEFNQATK